MFVRLFWIKQVKASKNFSRSCLQRRKIKKRRQKEFLTTWLCLNCKKSLQQLRLCVIVKRGLLFWKMFLSLLNRRTATWNLFLKQTMEMKRWWRNLFFSFSRATFRETSAEMKVKIACENIRFSSLFAAGDVSRETFPSAKSEEKRMFSQA